MEEEMFDLTNNPFADGYAQDELEQASIIVDSLLTPHHDDVPVLLYGRLNKKGGDIITFFRNPRSWYVYGRVQLPICTKLYHSHGGIGSKEILFSMRSDMSPPEEYPVASIVTMQRYGFYRHTSGRIWKPKDGIMNLDADTAPTMQKIKQLVFQGKLPLEDLYIETFEILTQRALLLFVSVLKQEQFVD
jgi:hypothetical protein